MKNFIAYIFLLSLLIGVPFTVQAQSKTRVIDTITDGGGNPRKGIVTFILTQTVTTPSGIAPKGASVSSVLDGNGRFDVSLYPSSAISPASYYQLWFAESGSLNRELLGVYNIPASATTISLAGHKITDTALAAQYEFVPASALSAIEGAAASAAIANLLAGSHTVNKIQKWNSGVGFVDGSMTDTGSDVTFSVPATFAGPVTATGFAGIRDQDVPTVLTNKTLVNPILSGLTFSFTTANNTTFNNSTLNNTTLGGATTAGSLTASGTVTANNFVGNCSACTGIGVGSSTGSSAIASLSFIADSDNNTTGVVDWITGLTTKLRLENNGTLTNFYNSGNNIKQKFKSSDGIVDFVVGMANYPNTFGSRPNNIVQIGWNPTDAGGSVSGEGGIATVWESYYRPDSGASWREYHVKFYDSLGVEHRAFSTINKVDNSYNVSYVLGHEVDIFPFDASYPMARWLDDGHTTMTATAEFLLTTPSLRIHNGDGTTMFRFSGNMGGTSNSKLTAFDDSLALNFGTSLPTGTIAGGSLYAKFNGGGGGGANGAAFSVYDGYHGWLEVNGTAKFSTSGALTIPSTAAGRTSADVDTGVVVDSNFHSRDFVTAMPESPLEAGLLPFAYVNESDHHIYLRVFNGTTSSVTPAAVVWRFTISNW